MSSLYTNQRRHGTCTRSASCGERPLNGGSLQEGISPITGEQACRLRELLFGHNEWNRSFSRGWLMQRFKFHPNGFGTPTYGLLQTASGPCGLLSGVQARICLELLFGCTRTCTFMGKLRPDSEERQAALGRALANILFQAGQGHACVAMKGTHLSFKPGVDGVPASFKTDNITEFIVLKEFGDRNSLLNFVLTHIQMFTSRYGGCVLFLYSLIMSRGIENVRNDMDEPDEALIGLENGFCSQELVNLVNVGRAVTNIFNGEMHFQDGDDAMNLGGIPQQAEIGFITAFDGSGTSVGSFYKNPVYPIWIVSSVDHYAVAFSTSRLKQRNCYVTYYDGYNKKAKEFFFSVRELADSNDNKVVEKTETVKVIEQCLRTKWPNICFVDELFKN